MNDKQLLGKLGNLIDDKLKPIKEQLNSVEMKVENVEMKVELVNGEVGKLYKKIEQSQEETIDALSELIHEGYNLHGKRIKKLEDAAQSSQTQ